MKTKNTKLKEVKQFFSDEIPKIPPHWKLVPLEEVCYKIENGGTPSTSVRENYDESGIPFIRGENVLQNGEVVLLKKQIRISKTAHENQSNSIIHPKDVLMNLVGPPLGKIGLVPDEIVEANINQGLVLMRTVPSYDPKLLWYCLRSPFYYNYILKMARGDRQLYIRESNVGKIPIPIIPPNEQKRLVYKLDQLFSINNSVKQALKSIPPLIKKLQRSILMPAFRGNLVENEKNSTPELLEKIRKKRQIDDQKWNISDDDLGESDYYAQLCPIPKTWTYVKLKDVIHEAQSGFACGKRDENGYVQLRMNNIGLQGKLVLDKILKVPKSETNLEKFKLKNNDILFNNTNSAELVGKTAIFRGEIENCVFSNHITRIRVDESLTIPEWATLLLLWQQQLGIFERSCRRFVGQAGLERDRILLIEYPLPPLQEQKFIVSKIEELVSSSHRVQQSVEFALQASNEIQRSILTKAFAGELVSKDPKDESSPVFAEKIRTEKESI